MGQKPFDKTTQMVLGLVAVGLALVLIFAAASEAGWISKAGNAVKIDLSSQPPE